MSNKNILIALSDGHGMQTPGKRTPEFTDGTRSPETNKNFMHENEFNRAVVDLVDKDLRRHGFSTLLVAPTDADTPLETRTNLANDRKANIYVSVHANALTGKWGSAARGIETFHSISSVNGTKLAQAIHRELIKGTKLVDRGLKNGGHLWEIRKTNMPAVLVECGFMDNLVEAKLLLSTAYRKECAEEITRGILNYYGQKYLETSPVVSAPPTNAAIDISKGIGTVKVRTADLAFRETPELSGKLIRRLKKDAIFYVYEKRGMWYNIGGGWASEGSAAEHLSYIPHPKTLYRVRKTWSDESSQVGTFYDLGSAKSLADEEGLTVFGDKGVVVYKGVVKKEEPVVVEKKEPTQEEILNGVPSWARKHLKLALDAGVTTGERLSDAPTRLELAVMFGKYIEYTESKKK